MEKLQRSKKWLNGLGVALSILGAVSAWSMADANGTLDSKIRYPKWGRIPKFHARVWFTDAGEGDGESIENFRELIEMADRVRVMRYSSTDSLGLPPEIELFRNLRGLDLTFYEGYGVPKELWKLSHLQTLSISWKGDISIDPRIAKLRNLRRLEVVASREHAIILPDEMGRMKQLEELEIMSAKSVRFPTRIEWTALRSLSLNLMPVNPWPKGLEVCPIDSLTLYSDSLKSLPEAIRVYKGLRGIDLAWNQLEDLPEFLTEFKELRHLGIAINQFDTLPEVVTRMPQLESIAAHANRGMYVPSSIGNLMNLKELLLSHNRMDSLTPAIGALKSLETLWIGGNMLKHLPASLGNCQQLRTLSAAGNPLESFPVEVARLPMLTECNFETLGLLNEDAETWEFLNRKGFLIPTVPESIAGQSLGYYLSRTDIDLGAKLYMQGKLRLRLDRLYTSILDSVGTKNLAAQPFYLHLLTTFFRPADADTSSKALYVSEMGNYQVREACAKATMQHPQWFFDNVMHGRWKHLYWLWLKDVPLIGNGMNTHEMLLQRMRENIGAEKAKVYEKDFFQLTWDLIEARKW